MSYELVIGLEIHLKITSKTKLFCSCENSQDFESRQPNTTICPVCTWHPGALPVLSEDALQQSLRLWRVLGCDIQQISSFDRKSYFYPDLPMGYQITQLYTPTCINGQVSFFVDAEFSQSKTVWIRDAHMETDTWKTVHINGNAMLDFNRAGTPLVEVVTDPDFRSADEVVWFLKEFQRLARYNDISDADMDKWQMRVDVNISVRPIWQEAYWTRVELKNINSPSTVKRAIAHEYQRQCDILDQWWVLEEQTRRWDDAAWESFAMRSKENALDYRYMPDPDLPPLYLEDAVLAKLKALSVLSPYQRILQMQQTYDFHKEYINALIADPDVLAYFDTAIVQNFDPKEVAKRIAWPIANWLKEQYTSIKDLPFGQQDFFDFLTSIVSKKINSNQAKTVMDEMLAHGTSPKDIIQQKGFATDWIGHDELVVLAQRVLDDNA